MRWVVRFLCCVLALLCLPACATFSGEEWQGISPSEFHFVPIVPLRGKGPGGWKVARVVITLVRKSGESSISAVCQVQVEVPEIHEGGGVTDAFAQQSAALAADAAAQRVLTLSLLSAELCGRFNVEMEALLKVPIPGARVSSFYERSRSKRLK